MKKQNTFQLSKPLMPLRLMVSYTVKEYQNSLGRRIESTGVAVISCQHYNKWNGLLTELLDHIGLLKDKSLLSESGYKQTLVQINSFQFPVPDKRDEAYPYVWHENAKEQVIQSHGPKYQEWLRYQHYPPNPDEPQAPQKEGSDE